MNTPQASIPVTNLRIVSLIPAATEMVAELGLIEHLVGVSHECNWPPEVKTLPKVVSSVIDDKEMPPGVVDLLVTNMMAEGQALYTLDEEAIRELKPTLILTQNLCQVCGASEKELHALLATFETPPHIITMSPKSLTDIAGNMRELGEVTGRQQEAEAALISWKARVDEVQERVQSRERVRCFVMEWVDPIYCSGHWVAEMVQVAGGVDLLARPGHDSVKISWDEVRASNPDVIILAPCGYNIDQSSAQLTYLQRLPGWSEIPAVQQKRVYAVNADAFITRPGPRVVDGIEMLAYLLHSSP